MIRAHHIGDSSTFLGQTCALCKQEFVSGDEIIICPEDGSRHHAGCWQANGNRCTAYGCRGEGAIGSPASAPPRPRPEPPRAGRRPRVITQNPQPARASTGTARPIPNAPGSKVRTLPAGSFGCARSCLIVAVILAVILFAMACFGLWSVANYMGLNLFDFPYRAPVIEGVVEIRSLLSFLGS